MRSTHSTVRCACWLAFLGFGLATAAVAAPVKLTLKVDGVTRTALVEPGKDAATTPAPVILTFHGTGGTSSEFIARGFAKAWPEATIVHLQGLSRRDPGSTGVAAAWEYSPGEFENRDLRFIDALFKELGATYKIDERRVYATGLSSGGIFAFYLIAARPERFAAFAPVAAWAPRGLRWAKLPRPAIITVGKGDYPYDAEVGRNLLLRLNNGAPVGVDWAPGATLYPPGPGGSPVVFALHNGGHEWPRDATANIVRFFKEQALSEPPSPPVAAPDTAVGEAAAGTGRVGSSGDGGPAAAALLNFPTAVAANVAGGIVIVDTNNHRVRRIAPDGTMTNAAGNGFYGFNTKSTAKDAQFFFAEAVTTDPAGNLFIADTGNRRILLVSPDGSIRTMAGSRRSALETSRLGFGGDGGPATAAELSLPLGLAVDAAGALYIADSENHRVRKVGLDGNITTVAGDGVAGFGGDDGLATAAQLNTPWGLALDSAGNLYIADSANHRVRRLAPNGTITTVAGSGAAGFSGDGGKATAAQLHTPAGLAVDRQGNLFIADSFNRRIRKVTPDGTITTVVGEGSSAPASLLTPDGITIDSAGTLFIADPFAQRVWKVQGVAAAGLIGSQAFP
jgi:sugar lactone lactonase YvrE/predicted esterase